MDRSRAKNCSDDRLDRQEDRDRADMRKDHKDRDKDTSADHRGNGPG